MMQGLRSPSARLSAFAFVAALLTAQPSAPGQDAAARQLRIIVFGAHPDDCELEAAGTASRWAKLGYKVKFVSVTNGDIGHHEMAGAILARRRTAEVKRCAEILGIETEVLEIHDGELMPTLENRRTITRKIREWQADVVISPRPNDFSVLQADNRAQVTRQERPRAGELHRCSTPAHAPRRLTQRHGEGAWRQVG